MSLTAVVAISMLVSGGLYVLSHERLNYANLSEGVITRSSLAALRGSRFVARGSHSSRSYFVFLSARFHGRMEF